VSGQPVTIANGISGTGCGIWNFFLTSYKYFKLEKFYGGRRERERKK